MDTRRMRKFFICVTAFMLCLSSCADKKSDKQIITEYVQEQFVQIDQLRLNERPLSLDEAEAYLYCWAFDGGFDDMSPEELREAIAVVLDCHSEIRNLIFSIDDIDCDDYR